MRGVEFVPSGDFGADIKILEQLVECIKVDFILIPSNPLGKPSVDPLVSAKMIQDALGVGVVATIRGGERDEGEILSRLKGVCYANLLGIACVSGDGYIRGVDAMRILELASSFDLRFKITTLTNLEAKISKGATHAISQPIFTPSYALRESIPIFANFMPIFAHETFGKIDANKEILGFSIPLEYQHSSNLMEANVELLQALLEQYVYLYLTPLQLSKQMPYLKELFANVK
ncbi:hypothetical protein [Helicobacter pametensis]|uniref:hypothetical protein n=1 Tax=Helicobacter pametensis TaxID=95149 RepID=UPI0004863DBA|nr:hypothetical protein [Helicobacter pametensis]